MFNSERPIFVDKLSLHKRPDSEQYSTNWICNLLFLSDSFFFHLNSPPLVMLYAYGRYAYLCFRFD